MKRIKRNKLPALKEVRPGDIVYSIGNHFMGNSCGNSGNSVRLYFLGLQKSLQMVTAAMKLKDAYSLEGKL